MGRTLRHTPREWIRPCFILNCTDTPSTSNHSNTHSNLKHNNSISNKFGNKICTYLSHSLINQLKLSFWLSNTLLVGLLLEALQHPLAAKVQLCLRYPMRYRSRSGPMLHHRCSRHIQLPSRKRHLLLLNHLRRQSAVPLLLRCLQLHRNPLFLQQYRRCQRLLLPRKLLLRQLAACLLLRPRQLTLPPLHLQYRRHTRLLFVLKQLLR